mgnify:FL=1
MTQSLKQKETETNYRDYTQNISPNPLKVENDNDVEQLKTYWLETKPNSRVTLGSQKRSEKLLKSLLQEVSLTQLKQDMINAHSLTVARQEEKQRTGESYLPQFLTLGDFCEKYGKIQEGLNATKRKSIQEKNREFFKGFQEAVPFKEPIIINPKEELWNDNPSCV